MFPKAGLVLLVLTKIVVKPKMIPEEVSATETSKNATEGLLPWGRVGVEQLLANDVAGEAVVISCVRRLDIVFRRSSPCFLYLEGGASSVNDFKVSLVQHTEGPSRIPGIQVLPMLFVPPC